MKNWKTEIFTIPNLMSFFRILLIPVFAWLYLHAQTTTDYYLATGVLLISSLTDLFDGKIARKFHMISKLGKALDPIADKATHAIVMLCLCTRYPIMIFLFLLTLIKEGIMGIVGLLFLRKGKMLNGAMWFGKVCTTILFVVLLVLVLVPNLPIFYVNVLCGICAVVMIVTLLLYIPVFTKMRRELTN